MLPSAYHLAQVNIGRMRGPLDGPVMAGFVALIESVNAAAEARGGGDRLLA